MKVRIETITPSIAKEYLSRNMVNRSLNVIRVDSYARTMKAGNWQLNGEAIRFNQNGELIDGQHRLSAIIKANVPVDFVVMSDIDNSVSVYDRGRNRSVTDELVIEGMDRRLASNQNVAVAKLHYAVQGKGKCYVSDDEVRDFLTEYDDLLLQLCDILKNHSGSKKQAGANARNAPFILASLYAIVSGESIENIQRLVDVFTTGFYNTINETAAIVCRNDFLAGNIGTHKESIRISSMHKFEKAIFDFCHGYPRKISYNSWDKPVYSNNAIFKNS